MVSACCGSLLSELPALTSLLVSRILNARSGLAYLLSKPYMKGKFQVLLLSLSLRMGAKDSAFDSPPWLSFLFHPQRSADLEQPFSSPASRGSGGAKPAESVLGFIAPRDGVWKTGHE